MMRFLGRTVANKQSCLMGRLQYRGLSSAAGVTTTASISKKIVEYCFKGAFCGVGYVLGGLTLTGNPKKLQYAEEGVLSKIQEIDELEAILDG